MINVPFVPNPNEMYCAQVSMAGVLAYYEARFQPDMETLRVLSGAGDEKDVTMSAGIALALYRLGMRVEYCNFASPEHLAAAGDPTAETVEILATASSLGIRTRARLDVANFRNLLEEKPIIALIDNRELWRTEGLRRVGDRMVGHFVTIVGFEDDNFVVHNPGPYKAAASLIVNASILLDAFNAPGTFNDAIILHGLK